MLWGCGVALLLLLQISGLLGHAARGDKKSPAVADTEVGLGGTCQWKLCGLDFDTTVAVLFEVTGSGNSAGDQGQVSVSGDGLGSNTAAMQQLCPLVPSWKKPARQQSTASS